MSRAAKRTKADTQELSRLISEALLGTGGLDGLAFIRRTDNIELLDTTTMKRTVQLELQLDPQVKSKWLPIGLLANNSYLGAFSIVDRDGRKLVSPSRSSMKQLVRETLHGQLEDAGLEGPGSACRQDRKGDHHEGDADEGHCDCHRCLCDDVIDCLGGESASNYCSKCREFYLRSPAGGRYGREATGTQRLQRRTYGCRTLAILAWRVLHEGPGGEDAIASETFLKSRRYRGRRNLLRLLFDLADSSVLVCESPAGDSEYVTLSYSYDEQIEEWTCPDTQVWLAKRTNAGRSGRAKFRRRRRNAKAKRKGRFAGKGPISSNLNKVGHERPRIWMWLRRIGHRFSGYRSWCIYWEAPSVGDYGSYHCDIHVPEGLSIRRATIVSVESAGNSGKGGFERGVPHSPDELGRRSHLVVSSWKAARDATGSVRRNAARRCHAATIVQIVNTNYLTWAIGASLGFVTAVLLGTYLVAGQPMATGNIDSIVTLLVTAPTLIGTVVGIVAFNEIGARLLTGAIMRIAVIAAAPLLAAIAIATCDTGLAGFRIGLAAVAVTCLGAGAALACGAVFCWLDKDNSLRAIPNGEGTDFLRRFPFVNAFVRGGEGERYVPSTWRNDADTPFPGIHYPSPLADGGDRGPTGKDLEAIYATVGKCLQSNEGEGEGAAPDA